MTPTYTAALISKAARLIPDARLVTLNSMADGAVGTIEYQEQLYEIRIVPAEYGIEKWSHPKKPQFEDGKVTDCCGSPDESNGDMSYSDIGICPECKDHCDFVEADDDQR